MQKRIAQSNEVRLGRLRELKSRDDSMQAVRSEAAAQLPALVQGSGYASLLESLILEALITVSDPVMTVQGVEGQAAACKKALPAATERFKEWALESKGGEFASKVAITFDPNPLSSGVGGCAVSGFGGRITVQNTLESRHRRPPPPKIPPLRLPP